SSNLSLIRALHFPRASLPLAYTLQELQQLGWSMAVLIAIVLVTGEPVTWLWLLIPVALLLQTLFNLGAALMVARIGAFVRDVNQLLPFALRTWLYASGVFYSIQEIGRASCRERVEIGWGDRSYQRNKEGSRIE